MFADKCFFVMQYACRWIITYNNDIGLEMTNSQKNKHHILFYFQIIATKRIVNDLGWPCDCSELVPQ